MVALQGDAFVIESQQKIPALTVQIIAKLQSTAIWSFQVSLEQSNDQSLVLYNPPWLLQTQKDIRAGTNYD